ncbi:Uncharacterised protein [Vibrio cholerae]|nr:Uncharacterised protein [Vibrio cholerae]
MLHESVGLYLPYPAIEQPYNQCRYFYQGLYSPEPSNPKLAHHAPITATLLRLAVYLSSMPDQEPEQCRQQFQQFHPSLPLGLQWPASFHP